MGFLNLFTPKPSDSKTTLAALVVLGEAGLAQASFSGAMDALGYEVLIGIGAATGVAVLCGIGCCVACCVARLRRRTAATFAAVPSDLEGDIEEQQVLIDQPTP